jgi:hypothetical protein
MDTPRETTTIQRTKQEYARVITWWIDEGYPDVEVIRC